MLQFENMILKFGVVTSLGGWAVQGLTEASPQILKITIILFDLSVSPKKILTTKLPYKLSKDGWK